MFRDPYMLEAAERVELIAALREAVALDPERAELRVLLGMALCVNFDAQAALEELRLAVRLRSRQLSRTAQVRRASDAPARLCSRRPKRRRSPQSLLEPVQSELARRQAATIRTMQREGIERGGLRQTLSVFESHRTSAHSAEQRNRNAAVALNSR